MEIQNTTTTIVHDEIIIVVPKEFVVEELYIDVKEQSILRLQ